MPAPESVVLVVCPVCGRNDRWQNLSLTGEHSAGGKRCAGIPELVAYTRPEPPPNAGDKCAGCNEAYWDVEKSCPVHDAPATDEHGEPWRRDDADELKAITGKTVLAITWPEPPAEMLADDWPADEIWIAFTDGTAVRLIAFGHGGAGAELRAAWAQDDAEDCPDCHGTGLFPHDPRRLERCATCHGTGKAPK